MHAPGQSIRRIQIIIADWTTVQEYQAARKVNCREQGDALIDARWWCGQQL